jgi:hypothetical protein
MKSALGVTTILVVLAGCSSSTSGPRGSAPTYSGPPVSLAVKDNFLVTLSQCTRW